MITSLTKDTVTVPQLSVVVTPAVFTGGTCDAQVTVTFAGQVMPGAALSSSDITCRQVAELPQSSVAIHVRLMVNSCAHAPATVTSLEVIVGVASQLSEAVAVPVFAGKVLAVQRTVTFAGQVIVGATLSSTTIVCVQKLELPQSSEAVQVRVMVNSCGHPPPTVTSLNPIVGDASQSTAVADPVLAGNVLAVHCMVTFAGQVITGAALSSTTMT